MAALDDLQTLLSGGGDANNAIKLAGLRQSRLDEANNALSQALGIGDQPTADKAKAVVGQLTSDMASDPYTGTAAQATAAETDPTQIAARQQKIKEAGQQSVANAQGAIAEEQAKTAGQVQLAAQQHQLEQANLTAPGGPKNPESAAGWKTDFNAKGEPSYQQIATPAQIQTQQAHAQAGLAMLPQMKVIVDALDKRGYVGPAMGRLAESATGSGPGAIITQHLMSGDSMKAANDWRTTLEGFKGNIAMANAGGRGGANPALLQRLDQMLSLAQSSDALRGGLQGAERWLTQYANAKTPADLAAADAELGIIPGAAAPTGGQ